MYLLLYIASNYKRTKVINVKYTFYLNTLKNKVTIKYIPNGIHVWTVIGFFKILIKSNIDLGK